MFGCFKIKEWNMITLFESNIEGNEKCHFMIILLLDWIYKDIFGVSKKISLNLISFIPIPSNFWKNENVRFWGNREELAFPPSHFIPFHLNSQIR